MYWLNGGDQNLIHFIFLTGSVQSHQKILSFCLTIYPSLDILIAAPQHSRICVSIYLVQPRENDVEGGEIKFTQHFILLHAESDIAIQWYARGYILSLLGYCIMPNKSTSNVNGKFFQLTIAYKFEPSWVVQLGFDVCRHALSGAMLCSAQVYIGKLHMHDVVACVGMTPTLFLAPTLTQPIAFPIALK